MVPGKSGYINTNGWPDYFLRIGWSEEYDIETNKSIVALTSFEAKYMYGGNWYPGGTLSVDGVNVVTMDNTVATHRIDPPYGGEAWGAIEKWVGGSLPPWVSGEIAHDADGSKRVTIGINLGFFRGDTGQSFKINETHTIELTTIPRASEITSAGNVTLGNGCQVKWTPKSASFRYRLKFSLGGWSYTTGAIHPNKTTEYTYSGYTIPLEVAEQILGAKTGTMQVELYTYSDSGATAQIGSTDSATFTVTVPDNDSTKPVVTMELAPVSTLAAKFAGLYIQGKTKVKATLTAEGKFKASIKSHSMKVEATTYDSDDSYTSDYLSQYGSIPVYGYATDSRGITGNVSEEITVLPYTKPKILEVDGAVIAARCDAEGNLADSGTYLKVRAKRSYSLLDSEGTQYNYCKIQYRYKLQVAESYSDWVTILEGDSLTGDEVDTAPLLGGVLSAKSTYVIEVRAIDDIGEAGSTTIIIPTDTVYMHRTKDAMGLGKYVEGENLLDVAWDTHLRGEVRIGASGVTLREYILAVISEGG